MWKKHVKAFVVLTSVLFTTIIMLLMKKYWEPILTNENDYDLTYTNTMGQFLFAALCFQKIQSLQKDYAKLLLSSVWIISWYLINWNFLKLIMVSLIF